MVSGREIRGFLRLDTNDFKTGIKTATSMGKEFIRLMQSIGNVKFNTSSIDTYISKLNQLSKTAQSIGTKQIGNMGFNNSSNLWSSLSQNQTGMSKYASQISTVEKELTKLSEREKFLAETKNKVNAQISTGMDTYLSQINNVNSALARQEAMLLRQDSLLQKVKFTGTSPYTNTQMMGGAKVVGAYSDIEKVNSAMQRQNVITKQSQIQWKGLTSSVLSGARLMATSLDFLFMIVFGKAVIAVTEAAESMTGFQTASKKYAQDMHWSGSQVNSFTVELERLQGVYTKIDMYDVGSEVLRMAQMYNLSNKEATSFLETSAIFTSAMAAEGRSVRDSTLALKDFIDQGVGWTRRLAEIGVTEENLKATGLWSGDKDNKQQLIAALDAVMKDRQLDLMAKNIYTLKDAGDALKISFGQLIASVLIPMTPSIIAITQGLTGLFRGISTVFKGMPEWAQVGSIIGIFAGIGIIEAIRNIANFSASLKLFGQSVQGVKNASGIVAKLKVLFGVEEVLTGVDTANKSVNTIANTASSASQGAGLATRLSNVGQNLKTMGYAFLYAATGIAMGVALISEAIILMQGPLWLLAETGKNWKSQEDNLKSGITSISYVMQSILYLSPLLISALAIGIIGTATTGPTAGVSWAVIGTAFVGTAIALVGIVGLISEAIYLMESPLTQLANLGKKADTMLPNAKKGLNSIDLISKSFGKVAEIISALNKMNSSSSNVGIMGGALIGAGVGAGIGFMVGGPIGAGVGGLAGAGIGALVGHFSTIESQLDNAMLIIDELTNTSGFLNKLSAFSDKVASLKIPDSLKTEQTEKFTTLISLVSNLGQMMTSLNDMNSMNMGASLTIFNEGDGADFNMDGWVSNIESAQAVLDELNSGKHDALFESISTFSTKINNTKITPINENGKKSIESIKAIVPFVTQLDALLDEIGNLAWDFTADGAINKFQTVYDNLFGAEGGGGSSQGIASMSQSSRVNSNGAFMPLLKKFIDKLNASTLPEITNTNIIPTLTSVKDIITNIAGVSTSLTSIPMPQMAVNEYSDGGYFGNALLFIQSMSSFIQRITVFAGTESVDLTNVITNTGNITILIGRINTLAPMLNTIPIDLNGDGYFNEAYRFLQGMNEFIQKVNASNFVAVTNLQAVFDSVRSLINNIKSLSNSLKTPINSMKVDMNSLKGSVTSSNSGIRSSFASTSSSVVSNIQKMINKVNEFKRIISSSSNLIAGGPAGGDVTSVVNVISSFAGSPSLSKSSNKKLFAGSPSLGKRAPKTSKNYSGPRPREYLPKRRTYETIQNIPLLNDEVSCSICGYAGGLFNSKEIINHVKKFKTGFSPDYWNWNTEAGDFQESSFPYKGKTKTAEAFILDAIGKTNYQFYFNSKGGSLKDIYNSGSFNCWDGANIILGMARSFGLGGNIVQSSWNGIPHVYANVQGIGGIDATAIQGGYGKLATGKYAGGGNISHVKVAGGNSVDSEKRQLNVTVNIMAPIYGVNDLKGTINESVQEAEKRSKENHVPNRRTGGW